ncbi:hypothetical protein WMF18_25165 [Sorangium sp. So ce315]|uniref:hypothetical protein n=1 Tax=Sorangium sp. So ce315 TaxID=3133299 RepID=UPI003F62A43C
MYRIAHNVATTGALRGRRDRLKRATPLETVAGRPEPRRDVERAAEGREALLRLKTSMRALRPRRSSRTSIAPDRRGASRRRDCQAFSAAHRDGGI